MSRLPLELRRAVGGAWAFRLDVERDATVQFERLAQGLEREGAPARLVDEAASAAEDERRHGGLCGELAVAYGVAAPPAAGPPPRLEPPRWVGAKALAYGVVAHCCVAETESVATLTGLVRRAGPRAVRQALVAIARDEVKHSQLGWAYLAWASEREDLAFLGPHLPAMMGPAAEGLFGVGATGRAEEDEDERLLEHGVLPRSERRSVFLATMDQVVLPGLERAGISGAAAREWLARRREGLGA